MKKRILGALILFLFAPVCSYAMSIGSPATQGRGKFSVGLDSDYIFSRETRKGKDFRVGGAFTVTTKLSITSVNQTLLKVSYGLFDGLDVYARAGVVNPRFYRKTEGVLGVGSLNAKLKGDTSLIYGGGLKGALTLPAEFILGCDLQYLRYAADYTGTQSALFIPMGVVTSGKIISDEWQAAPYIAKKIGGFTPYVGAKYAHMNLADKETRSGHEFFAGNLLVFPAGYTSKNVVGAFCGLDYLYKDKFFFNVEGRFIDETAASIGLGCKF